MKFRAWDKDFKHMYKSDNPHLSMSGSGVCINLQTGEKLEPEFYSETNDRNGTLICQGDIVRVDVCLVGRLVFNAEVKFDGESGWTINSNPLCLLQSSEYEIIGHVRKNPELLEKK